MSPFKAQTNYFNDDGDDLGNKLISKDYLISVYPVLSQSIIQITPELWIWGWNGNGQLGTNDTTNRSIPVTTFVGGINWKQVSTGYRHTTAVKTDGTLWTWGYNGQGRLGINSSIAQSTPVTTFAGGTDWKQVDCGYNHTAAIKTNGTLWTWGNNGSGRLGINNNDTKSTPVTTFAGGTNWKQVSCGDDDTSAIKTDGTLWVWGYNGGSNLGTNDETNKSTPVTTFAGGTDWKQISCFYDSRAAIKTDGTLWVWGFNWDGQLGTNDTTEKSTPVTTFAGGTNWKQVSVSTDHTVAIKTDGTLWAWGNNSDGRLGINDTTIVSTPVTTFAGGNNWADTATGGAEELYTLVGGYNYSAAIKTDGTLWVWGTNSNGYLGTYDTTHRSTPVTTFAGGSNWKQISSGGYHTSAIKTDGTLWVWGYNDDGQLGTNDLTIRSTPVTTFAGGTDWKQVSNAHHNTTAIKTNGTLWTWGNNGSGRLGTNDTITRYTPVTTFAGDFDWRKVSCKDDHVAAIKVDGTLWVWGSNSAGQLATNDNIDRNTPVTTSTGGFDWRQASAGRSYTAAIKTDGTLWTWGYNGYGQLGTNDLINRSTPVTTFAGGTDWKQISAVIYHTTAVKTDGTLWLWGYNYDGQLGTNDLIDRSTPVTTFAGGTNWKQVNCGYRHTVALQDDGVNKKLYVFGSNEYGALGFVVTNYEPREVFGQATNWKQVSAGRKHTAAIKTDGTLWVWGYNSGSNLGTNDETNKSIPVTTFIGGTNWKQVNCGGYTTVAIQSQDII